ncbi:hypothetical protein VUR80DRAFT_5962 [Thermomyces stellatus]
MEGEIEEKRATGGETTQKKDWDEMAGCAGGMSGRKKRCNESGGLIVVRDLTALRTPRAVQPARQHHPPNHGSPAPLPPDSVTWGGERRRNSGAVGKERTDHSRHRALSSHERKYEGIKRFDGAARRWVDTTYCDDGAWRLRRTLVLRTGEEPPTP